jgi:hypothetical protein
MNAIVIFSAKVAKDLIKKKYKLLDISSAKENKLKTIFYFANNEDLRKYLEMKHNIKIDPIV